MDYPKRDAHGNPETPWAIRCGAHGLVYLSKERYDKQMNQANHLWRCPIEWCDAYWDDDNYERFMEDNFDEATS